MKRDNMIPEGDGVGVENPGASSKGSGGETIAYLAKMFPRISETFILREVLTLRRSGLPLKIYSLMPPTRDHRMHPEAAALLPEVHVISAPSLGGIRRFLGDYRECWRIRPMATWRESLRLLRRPGRRNGRRFWRAISLAAQLRRDRAVHLHAAWAHTPASVARITCRIMGFPYSVGGHAKDVYLGNPSSIRKKVHSARFITVCSKTLQDHVRQICQPEFKDQPLPEIELNYHGVNTQYFTASGESRNGGDPFRLLSVGRLVPKKGFDLLLKAAMLLKDRGIPFQLDIIGSGLLQADLEKEIVDLDLSAMVNLRGMLVQEEVLEAYRRADLCILASRVTEEGDRDGIANTLAEAMSCGLPVVASRLPSLQELVSDGESGLLVDPENFSALADTIERLLKDDKLRAKLGGEARRRMVERFDQDLVAENLILRFEKTQKIERILYFSADRGVPVRGYKGASVHVRSMVKALGVQGLDVQILTARRGPKDGPQVEARIHQVQYKGRIRDWIESKIGGKPRQRAWLRLLDNISQYREARRIFATWRPDMIYERYALTAVAGSWLARRWGLPHILEVNAPLAEEESRFRDLKLAWLAHYLERWILRRADRVIVVSHPLADHAMKLGVPRDKILVLPNAVDPGLFHPGLSGDSLREELGWRDDFIVGFSGTLKPWHGVEFLIRAAADLSPVSRQTRLLLIGDGPQREALLAEADKLGLTDSIKITGSLSHEDVGRALAACDVLTAPYGPMDDHWFSPLKVVEYRAVGRPVIASALGQMGKTLSEKEGVLLVPPGDVKALTHAMESLRDDNAARLKLAEAAAASSHWTWSELASRMLEAAEAARREIWGWER